jgi:hypothetical protein
MLYLSTFKCYWTRGMTQAAEYPLSKHKALSWNTSTTLPYPWKSLNVKLKFREAESYKETSYHPVLDFFSSCELWSKIYQFNHF